MRSMIVSPEEQVRNVARTLLNVATEPGRRRNRKGDYRSVVEGLAVMIERLLTGDLKPIEVALGDEPFSLHPPAPFQRGPHDRVPEGQERGADPSGVASRASFV